MTTAEYARYIQSGTWSLNYDTLQISAHNDWDDQARTRKYMATMTITSKLTGEKATYTADLTITSERQEFVKRLNKVLKNNK